MNTPFPAVFRADIAHAHQRLRKVTEQQATQPFREVAWLRKELLGHLIDSAVHNHVRFLAAAHGELTAAPYAQQSCVTLFWSIGCRRMSCSRGLSSGSRKQPTKQPAGSWTEEP
ncbi:MAG TPA: hypothetical protein VM120_07435 [Bryobacteraceae bacterium]|nr:hypothetical protein [Bryobacteraceae bacterium]